MKIIEMFFDYNCPYCLKGYEQLTVFLKDKPTVQMVWHPCEIDVYKNPSHSTYKDISLQGMFFAADNNIDLWQYHEKVYNLVFREKVNTHNLDIFSGALKELLDAAAFREAIKSGKYVNKLIDANNYAFKETKVHVVPTYRTDGGVLMDRQEFFNMGPTDTGYSR